MNALKTCALRTALDALHASRIARLFERSWSGVGTIFMLHRVLPDAAPGEFAPNAYLSVTPAFLDCVLRIVKQSGRDIVDLDEMHARLAERRFDRKFACFTFDDGYRDVLEHALPVFARHEAPFTLYLTTGMPDGTAVLWWDLLEEVFRRAAAIELNGRTLPAASLRDKKRAFLQVYWHLRGLGEAARREQVLRLCEIHGVDAAGYCRSVSLDWPAVARLCKSPFARIEAHTVSHPALSRVAASRVRDEADRSRTILGERLGRVPRHFAYPYGDAGSAGPREFAMLRELGFATATTTRKGTLFPEHAEHLHALPRVSLNGDYQAPRYVKLFLTGAPFALWQRFRRLDVA